MRHLLLLIIIIKSSHAKVFFSFVLSTLYIIIKCLLSINFMYVEKQWPSFIFFLKMTFSVFEPIFLGVSLSSTGFI